MNKTTMEQAYFDWLLQKIHDPEVFPRNLLPFTASSIRVIVLLDKSHGCLSFR